jgi:hypothetical protein
MWKQIQSNPKYLLGKMYIGAVWTAAILSAISLAHGPEQSADPDQNPNPTSIHLEVEGSVAWNSPLIP